MANDTEQQRNGGFEESGVPAEQVPEESEDASANEHARFKKETMSYILNHCDKPLDQAHKEQLFESLSGHFTHEELENIKTELQFEERKARSRVDDVVGMIDLVKSLVQGGEISSETVEKIKDELRLLAEESSGVLDNVGAMENVVEEADSGN